MEYIFSKNAYIHVYEQFLHIFNKSLNKYTVQHVYNYTKWNLNRVYFGSEVSKNKFNHEGNF